jgi:hypothetical protein
LPQFEPKHQGRLSLLFVWFAIFTPDYIHPLPLKSTHFRIVPNMGSIQEGAARALYLDAPFEFRTL